MDIDPTIKSLVCDDCWNGVFFPTNWQAVLDATPDPFRPGSPKGYSYETSWATIQNNAEHKKCNWCNVLVCLIAAKTGGDMGVDVRAACEEDSDCTPTGEKKLKIVARRAGVTWERQYYMYTNSVDKAAKYVKARDRIRDVALPESYDLALECLKNCLDTHHAKCPKPDPNARIPDRVIDCSGAGNPKLVETGGKMHGRFIALSYVWGGSQPMTLKENIAEHKKELVMSKFPPTIQHAVRVTRGINERYLWIDALCIIQDDKKDTFHQLAQMRNIYRNSYLTINAACAKSTSEGFLHQNRPMKKPDARIPYPCPDGPAGSVWIAKQMDTEIPDATHSYWDEIEPITYRGWCLQEKLLPPRSLVYAKDTLKFYCQTETVNIGHALCEPSTGMRLPHVIYQPSSSPLSAADQATYRLSWLSVLFTYTIRGLTKEEDKLKAVAGVAEQFYLVNNDEYLAGLWRKTLLQDLLWSATYHKKVLRRPISYRAPTWSWASVDGIIMLEYSWEKKLVNDPQIRKAQILDCQVKLASAEVPFGEVMSAMLKLKGFMKPVILEGWKVMGASGGQSVQIGGVSFDAEETRPRDAFVIPLMWDEKGPFSAGIVVVKDLSEIRRIGRFSGASSEDKKNKWLEGLKEEEIVLV